MSGVEESLAQEAFKLAAAKLPISTKFVSEANHMIDIKDIRSKGVKDLEKMLDDLWMSK